MKKLISLLVVLTMVMTLMSGCVFGTKEEAETTPSTDTTTTEPIKEASADAAVTEAAATEEAGLPAMTTEDITLTYLNFDSEV
ncbi:MAG: hypothetical protein WBI07_12200, partial [Mobilitalea sp.]